MGSGCAGLTVNFATSEAFVDDATSARVTLALARSGSPGTVNVTMTFDGQTSAITPADQFTYT